MNRSVALYNEELVAVVVAITELIDYTNKLKVFILLFTIQYFIYQ